MNDEAQLILEVEAARCAAIGNGDVDALSALLADDYLHVFGDARTTDRAGYIARITEVPRVPIRSGLGVRVYGDVAVLCGNLLNTVKYPDRGATVYDTFVTQVLHKQNGRWRFVSFQITQRPRTP